jgi:hypothetical protein
MLNRRAGCKPPSVSFEIPRAVLALPIRLIDGLRIDERTSRTSPLVVRIDIIHMYEETRIRDIRGQGGIETMFRRHAMQPNRGVTRTDLAMDGLTFGVSRHAPTIEAEGIDEEIVSRLDVLVSQNRNDSLEVRHECFPVKQSVFMNEQFSQRRLPDFWNNSPAVRKSRQTVRDFQSTREHSDRTVDGRLRNVVVV